MRWHAACPLETHRGEFDCYSCLARRVLAADVGTGCRRHREDVDVTGPTRSNSTDACEGGRIGPKKSEGTRSGCKPWSATRGSWHRY